MNREQKVELAKLMLSNGDSYRKIAKKIGVDKSTISYWVKINFSFERPSQSLICKEGVIKHCSKLPHHYSYILGSYLGDGCISKTKRTYKMRIFNCVTHKEIISDQKRSLKKLFSNNKVSSSRTHAIGNCIQVLVYNKSLPIMFPQYGDGKKHDRDVSLKDWQLEIIRKEPECFIKGLVDSDGSYFYSRKSQPKNSDVIHMYYQFTNTSKDILNVYRDTMDLLGIHYTSVKKIDSKNGAYNIFTRRIEAVARMDEVYEIADNKIRLD